MKRKYLISYNTPPFFVLADYVEYELEFKIVWLWGLFETRQIKKTRIPNRENIGAYFKHWDELIKTQKPI